MQEIISKIHDTLESSVLSCKSHCLSVSGGLDSSIIAYHLRKKPIHGISIIAEDFLASDLTYCQILSRKFEFPLDIISATSEIILNGLEETIKILKNFNDIEIRNSCVMFLSIQAAKNLGHDRIITGDGSDELFAGYHFLQNKSEEELEKEKRRIWEIMHFPSIEIGKSLGVKVETPFLDPKFIKLAKSIPLNLNVKSENQTRYGKWILRKTYEDKIPNSIVWRRKVPMQDGAGTTGLTHLFETIISDEIFESKKKSILNSDGVTIRTKESLHYYETYRKYYDISSKLLKGKKKCPYCQYGVEKHSKFCKMCGSFPI